MGAGAGVVRTGRVPRLVAFTAAGVVGAIIATSAITPTSALDITSPPVAEWTENLSPTTNGFIPFAPLDVFEYKGVVHVADPAGVDRFDAATGSPLPSFAAPTDVVIADIVVNASGAIYAVGTFDAGDPQIWVGRYTSVGVLDWSDSYGNPLSTDPPPFGSGDDGGVAVALDGVGGVYVGGILDRAGGFLSIVSVRKYTDAGTPASQWLGEYLADEASSIADMGASTNGVYVVGGWVGPFAVPYVLRLNPATGATEVFSNEFSDAFVGYTTSVAVTPTDVYVAVSERFRTAAGDASDARVVKFDDLTLNVVWSDMIGTTFGVLPDLGSEDHPTDVIAVGTTIYVTGTSNDPAIIDPIGGVAGTGGFLRQLTDNGATATVDFTAATPPGQGLGSFTDAVYMTGSDDSGLDTCEVSSNANSPGTCFLTRISDTRSTTPWPDFDGDGSADRSVFRPEFGGWYVDGQATEFLGLGGDVPVPGDYDGDGATDRAVYRAGAWYIQGQPTAFLGVNTDLPVPGDYDGDGDWEPAVYRDGAWFIDGQPTRYLGSPGDIPVPGDYDGDGTTDIAVYRPAVGGWYVDAQTPQFYGLPTDTPVPGDYDGDGTTDIAVYRPAVGGWYVDGQTPEFIGLESDTPVPADYNGDGVTERAVFRPSVGGWYVDGAPTVFYGLGTDIPLPLPAAIWGATTLVPA